MHLTNTMPIEMKKKILITGGAGLIGTRLTALFLSKGYQVNVLSRSKRPNSENVTHFLWNIDRNEIDINCFEGVGCIVNLAGAGVADKRWSDKRKALILSSRVDSLRLLGEALTKNNIKIDTLISASATGYYGVDDIKLFEEDDSNGTDFLASVVVDWEIAVDRLQSYFKNIVKIRIGLVLASEGGAFVKIVQPIKLFVGAPLGTGKQAMPWIHVEDLCELMVLAFEKSWRGNFNAVTGITTNEEFTKIAAHQLNKPLILPNVPKFVLQLMLGDMTEMVLRGIRVSGDKILEKGFKPKFTDVNDVIKNLIKG